MRTLKVVIADDEVRICQLIQALVNWEEMGMEIAGTPNNGIDACEVIEKVCPDILITDIRMPGCSGLELIEKIKKTKPELEIIIISGYAHFEYAQQAIRYGVGYYLLKPINKVELMGILEKLKNKIGERIDSEQNRQELLRQAKRNDDRIREEFLLRLAEGEKMELSEEILAEIYHIYGKPGLYQAFCLKMDCEGKELSESSVSVLMEKTREIVNRELKEKCMETVILVREIYCIGIINYEAAEKEKIRRSLKNCLSQAQLQKSIFEPVSFSMSVGMLVTDTRKLGESVQEALKLIPERMVKGSGRLLENLGEPSSLKEENLLEKYLREITIAVEVMSAEQADAAVIYLQNETRKIKNIHGYELLELIGAAADLFAACVQMQERSRNLELFKKQCRECTGTEKLFGCLLDFQRRFIMEMAQKHENDTVRPVRKAKEYIQSHYSEPLTLEGISEMVGLSTAYFSALFKKTEGEGFAKYLINVRIEQAKVLLRETNLPVTEVCRRVGYNDLRHFTHTFERATEVKPSVYRKLYG